MNVTIVIVHFRTPRLLDQCLRTIAPSLGAGVDRVVVVDNASGDEETAAVARSLPWVTWVWNPANHGFARACNQGAALASGGAVLFLNPDAQLDPADLVRLAAFLEACPRVGVVGCQQVDAQGNTQPSWGSFPRLLGMVRERFVRAAGEARGRPAGPRVGSPPLEGVKVDWVTGAALLIRREALAATGGFDERFWLFAEDVDLCWRVGQAGFDVAWFPGVTITHVGGASSHAAKPWAEGMRMVSLLRYFEKHHPGWEAWLARGGLAGLQALRWGRATWAGQDAAVARARLSALVWPSYTPPQPHAASPSAAPGATRGRSGGPPPSVGVCVIAWKRAEHLRGCLESLAQNPGASALDVRVFVDGPRNDEDVAAIASVLEVARSARGFRSVEVVARPRNVGLSRNVIDAVTATLAEFEAVIVLEDDLVLSPGFLDYMQQGLALYRDEPRVASLHGYGFPVEAPLPETFFMRGADCWGWATWRRGWAGFRPDGAALLAELRARGLERAFDLDGAYPNTRLLERQARGEVDSWAIRWHASAFLAGQVTLHPGRSLVANVGHDGTGTNSRHTGAHEVALSPGVGCLAWQEPVVDTAATALVARHRRRHRGLLPRALDVLRGSFSR